MWFLRLFPVWIALILAISIWDNHANGRAFDWTLVWAGMGFLAFTGGLYAFARLIYKFVLRYARHRDNQPR